MDLGSVAASSTAQSSIRDVCAADLMPNRHLRHQCNGFRRQKLYLRCLCSRFEAKRSICDACAMDLDGVAASSSANCSICDAHATYFVPKATFATPLQQICVVWQPQPGPKAAFATPVQQISIAKTLFVTPVQQIWCQKQH